MKKMGLLSIAVAALLAVGVTNAADEMPPMPPVDGEATIDDNTGQVSELDIKVKLKTGWNMFGLPGYKSYKPVDLLGQKEYIEQIYWYHPDAGWKPFNPESPDRQVVAFVPGMAIWIKAKKPFVLSFKTNIPSNLDVYEMASFIAPKVDTNKLDELKGDNLFPPMPIATASYSDTWTEDGDISEKFVAGVGTQDWSNFKPDTLSSDLKDTKMFFDFNVLVNKVFKDEVNKLKYRFKPDETAYNALKVAIRNEAGVETVGSAFLEQGKVLVLAVMGSEGVKKVKYEMVEVVKDGTTTVLRLKSEDKKPAKWIVSSVYNEKIGSWSDPKDLENQNLAAKDKDLKSVNWDNLTAANSDTSFAFVAKSDFVPQCKTADGKMVSLTKKPDGSYPFPGDPYFPKECTVDDKALGKPQDIKYPTATGNAPELEKDTQLNIDMENCKPYSINFNKMFKNQPESFGLYWKPEGSYIGGLAFENRIGLLKGYVNATAGAYTALVDASNKYGVSKQLQVMINVSGDNTKCGTTTTATPATSVEFKPSDTTLVKDKPVCKGSDGKEYEVPKTAAGYFATPNDPEFPAACKASTSAVTPKCKDINGNMVDVPKRADGSYYAPHEAEFQKVCSVSNIVKPADAIQSANLLCDANKDGKVSDEEKQKCRTATTSSTAVPANVGTKCDTNGDGKTDEVELKQCAQQQPAGEQSSASAGEQQQ